MSQQTRAPVRVKEELEDETTEVMMTTRSESEQQVTVKQEEEETEPHPLPVPSTSNHSSSPSSHLIKREYSDSIRDQDDAEGKLHLTETEDEKDQLRQWVRVVDPGTPPYLPPEWEDEEESQANLNVHLTQSEANSSTISTDHQTAPPESAQIVDSLRVNEQQQLQQTSVRQTTAVNYRNTEVNTDSSDDETGNSHDQHENAQLNNSAAAAPARPTQNRTLSPQTNDTPDSNKRTKPASYRCTIPGCARVYQSRVGLYFHQAVHSGKFTCSECGKPCPNNAALKQHHLTHTTEKPHQCTECHRAFADNSSLTSHRRIHSGEKPFQCTYCDRTFAQSGSLTVHLRTHTHDRPYKCEDCSFASVRKDSLTRHLRQHTGQLPFQCEQCSKRFNRKDHLTNHMRAKHSKLELPKLCFRL